MVAVLLIPHRTVRTVHLSALASNLADSIVTELLYHPPYCPPLPEANSGVKADSRPERTVFKSREGLTKDKRGIKFWSDGEE